MQLCILQISYGALEAVIKNCCRTIYPRDWLGYWLSDKREGHWLTDRRSIVWRLLEAVIRDHCRTILERKDIS
jgi:hypothetical protein